MPFCAKCGAQYDDKFDGCPLCANSAAVPAPPVAGSFTIPMDKASLIGIGGGVLLFIGTFLPVLRFSLQGIGVDYSLLAGGPGAETLAKSADSPTSMFMMLGIVLAIAGVASVALVVMKIWTGLWASGGVALLAVAYGFLTLTGKISDLVKSAGAQGSLVSAAIQPGWGWGVLFVGAALVLAAAFLSQQKAR